MGRLAIFQKMDRAFSDIAQCARRNILRYQNGTVRELCDSVIEEVLFELYIDGVRESSFTCSPWNIEELTMGRLFLNGTIRSIEDIRHLEVCRREKRIEVSLANSQGIIVSISGSSNIIPFGRMYGGAPKQNRRSERAVLGVLDSSCVTVSSRLMVSFDDVCSGISSFEKSSALFHRTGGVHAAALVDKNAVIARFEDIGRHSAMDKLVGWCIGNRMAVNDKVIVFSGRIPQEIIMKVVRLGCPVIISPGAPTSLSIDLAERYGITLIGFAKRNRFNVYSHAERIADARSVAL